MKKLFLLPLISLLMQANGYAQSQTEKITKTGSFQNTRTTHVLSVVNVQGFVKVEGYNGDKIMLEGLKTISAKNQQDLAKGMQEMQLQLVESGDSVYVYLDAPFIFRKKTKGRSMNINMEDVNYDYKFDLTLKVPFNTNLDISTINNGDVTVNNTRGNLKVRNVNGGIFLNDIAGATDANTVNGPVEVRYAQNPTASSSFKTINGPVKVYCAPKLNATVSFKSMNVQFYTNLSDLEMLPVKVTHNTNNNGSGTVYKVDKNQNYKVGQGGINFAFETLNVNIYLQKK